MRAVGVLTARVVLGLIFGMALIKAPNQGGIFDAALL